jgi:plasmid maintenance system antidote protein VapI
MKKKMKLNDITENQYHIKKHIKFILEELKNNKTITIEDLLTKLNITRRHISRIIKENYISLKLFVFALVDIFYYIIILYQILHK